MVLFLCTPGPGSSRSWKCRGSKTVFLEKVLTERRAKGIKEEELGIPNTEDPYATIHASGRREKNHCFP